MIIGGWEMVCRAPHAWRGVGLAIVVGAVVDTGMGLGEPVEVEPEYIPDDGLFRKSCVGLCLFWIDAEYDGGGGGTLEGLGDINGYGGGGSDADMVLVWYKLSACICWESCCWAYKFIKNVYIYI